MRTGPFPNVVQYGDATANDSDKTYTVPTGKAWRIRSVYALLATTATVGNRQVDVLFTDAADVTISKFVAGAVQAASGTKSVLWAPGQPQETTFTANAQLRALADGMVLPAGYKIRVYDSAAIAPAADDMTVSILVEEMTE